MSLPSLPPPQGFTLRPRFLALSHAARTSFSSASFGMLLPIAQVSAGSLMQHPHFHECAGTSSFDL